jgi:hypothetical protein
MTTSPDDRPTWLRFYLEEYWTLEEVGEYLGITREGVRQRLKAMGIKSRSSGETARLRERREISERGDEIRNVFFQTRDVVETARQVALGEALVQRAIGELVPDFGRCAGRGRDQWEGVVGRSCQGRRRAPCPSAGGSPSAAR